MTRQQGGLAFPLPSREKFVPVNQGKMLAGCLKKRGGPQNLNRYDLPAKNSPST
jgi:hypothetical protein